jgi:acyl carrier protein
MGHGMDLRTRIREYIIESFLFGDAEPLTGDGQSLLESGIVDSTGVMELVAFLEGDLGISVADEELVPDNLDSVDNLVAFVRRKQAAA